MKDKLITALEIAGAAAVAVGFGLVFGLGVALVVGGILAIGAGWLLERS